MCVTHACGNSKRANQYKVRIVASNLYDFLVGCRTSTIDAMNNSHAILFGSTCLLYYNGMIYGRHDLKVLKDLNPEIVEKLRALGLDEAALQASLEAA